MGITFGGILFLTQVIQAFQSLLSKSVVIIGPLFISASILFIISASGLQVIAWRLLMNYLGVNISWREVIESFTLSFLPRYVPGSIWGYFSRAEWLKQSHNTPYSISIWGSILDITLIFLGIGLVSVIFIFQSSNIIIKISVSAFFCTILYLGWLITKRAMAINLFGKFLNKRLTPIKLNIHFIQWLILCTLHGIAWFLYGASINCIIKSILPNITLAITKTTHLFALSWLLGFIIPFIPSGLGVREQSLSTLLTFNLPLSFSQAINIAIISRLLITFVEINWLIIGFLIRFLHMRRNNP